MAVQRGLRSLTSFAQLPRRCQSFRRAAPAGGIAVQPAPGLASRNPFSCSPRPTSSRPFIYSGACIAAMPLRFHPPGPYASIQLVYAALPGQSGSGGPPMELRSSGLSGGHRARSPRLLPQPWRTSSLPLLLHGPRRRCLSWIPFQFSTLLVSVAWLGAARIGCRRAAQDVLHPAARRRSSPTCRGGIPWLA